MKTTEAWKKCVVEDMYFMVYISENKSMLWVVVQVFEWKFFHLMNLVSLPLVKDCAFKILQLRYV